MISVKANQKKLYQQLKELASTQTGWSVDLKHESAHGRRTQRLVSVFELPASIQQQWPGAQVGITVVRWGTRGEKPYFEQHYYISSWREKASALQDRIRAHWGIENPLHWVKDVVLGEDHSSIAAKPAAAVMGMIRNLVITLFRRAGHASITTAIDYFGNDLDQLLPMLEFFSA